MRSRQGGGAVDPRWRASSAEPTSAMAANCSLCEGTRQTYCINRRLQESYELLHPMRCECRRISKAELRRICQVQRRRGGAHSGATRACPDHSRHRRASGCTRALSSSGPGACTSHSGKSTQSQGAAWRICSSVVAQCELAALRRIKKATTSRCGTARLLPPSKARSRQSATRVADAML